MILLDTNVLSALMRRDPDTAVVAWLDRQPASSLWTTAVTVFEVRFGIDLLADGRERRRLEQAFTQSLAEELEGRVLAFDQAAAEAAGTLAAARQRAGRSLEIRDLQIAGIARAHKAALATRNARHFAGLGVKLVDPWSA